MKTPVCAALTLLLVVALGPLPGRAGGEGPRIQSILTAVRAGDPASLARAEDELVALGAPAVPALTRALSAESDPGRRGLLRGALFRLRWRVNPRALVEKWLRSRLSADQLRQAALWPLDSDALAASLPAWRFYAVRFRQWPVGVRVPAPLEASNVFAVSGRGQVKLLATAEALESFFRSALPRAAGPQAQKEALLAWLTLSPEFSQDGFFRFTLSKTGPSLTRNGPRTRVRGRVEVVPQAGNEGFIQADLSFDESGRLLDVQEQRQVKAGVRPICQATLLLHPEPLVRRMAERDLLVLGPLALPYLEERRAQASPRLRQAIDSIRARIRAGQR
jgi:hypothetical protein